MFEKSTEFVPKILEKREKTLLLQLQEQENTMKNLNLYLDFLQNLLEEFLFDKVLLTKSKNFLTEY
jgi:hypothetical protein